MLVTRRFITRISSPHLHSVWDSWGSTYFSADGTKDYHGNSDFSSMAHPKRRDPRIISGTSFQFPNAPFLGVACLLPVSEWGPSSHNLTHMHFIVLKLCNSAVLIYEGCISSSDPCWYRTHNFPFMCLCQRATGNQLLETGLKKKPTKSLNYPHVITYPQYLPTISKRTDLHLSNWDCGHKPNSSLV